LRAAFSIDVEFQAGRVTAEMAQPQWHQEYVLDRGTYPFALIVQVWFAFLSGAL
jgi:hypothetical protein